MPMLTGTQKSFSTGSYYAKTSTGWLLCTQIQCFKSGAFFQHFKCSPQGCIWPLPSLFRYSGWEERSILSIPLHVSEHKSRRHLSDPTLAGDNQACIRLKPFRRRCPDMFSVTWELCTTENKFWSQTKFGAAGKWGFRIGDNLISTCLQLGKHLGAWKRFLHRLMKEGGSCSLFA